ncbi:MAG: NAD-dependent epimerase/dehydratase family protein [Pseudomonadota bacterium]
MSRVLLLGATGLIGTAVADRFTAEGHHVTGVMRNTDRAPESVAQAIAGDLGAPEEWLPLLADMDALIHCACDWAGDMARTEPHLIEGVIASGFRGRVLYTGGVWLYRPGPDQITEDSPIAGCGGFDWSTDGWDRLMAAGLDAVLIHPGLVWRDGVPHYSPAEEALNARKPLPVPAPGEQIQPLIHSTDLADGYLRALTSGQSRRDYLFVAENAPMQQVIEAWAAASGLSTVRTEARDDDPYTWSQRVNSARARDELGWVPRFTDSAGFLAARPGM